MSAGLPQSVLAASDLAKAIRSSAAGSLRAHPFAARANKGHRHPNRRISSRKRGQHPSGKELAVNNLEQGFALRIPSLDRQGSGRSSFPNFGTWSGVLPPKLGFGKAWPGPATSAGSPRGGGLSPFPVLEPMMVGAEVFEICTHPPKVVAGELRAFLSVCQPSYRTLTPGEVLSSPAAKFHGAAKPLSHTPREAWQLHRTLLHG
jgi:hypothetical protein